MSHRPTITAVTVAYGAEDLLVESARATMDSTGVDITLVVIDNGYTGDRLDDVRSIPGVTVLGDGTNLGFAGACNLGARGSDAEFIALVNSDAVVDPDALAALAEVADRPEVGIAGGSIRLHDEPEVLNSAGNELHFLGYSWCGSFGLPASTFPDEREITTAMASGIVLRRSLWEALEGFDEHYFAYHEDVELSLRCRMQGLEIRNVPHAVVRHNYHFDRHPAKLYLVERNRFAFWLIAFERRTQLILAPAFVVSELGTLGLALAQGWMRQKLSSYRWLVANRRWIARRRAQIQAERVVSDRELVPWLQTSMRFQPFPLPWPARIADVGLRAYWAVARRLL